MDATNVRITTKRDGVLTCASRIAEDDVLETEGASLALPCVEIESDEGVGLCLELERLV